MNKKYFYLIELQYLGFRYHGWAKQPEVKTVQGMLNRTLKYVLGDVKFKTLASGRTDAMVSANQAFVELFTYEKLDEAEFFSELNVNLPHDIRALNVEAVDEKFNVIQNVTQKEYTYLFSFGEKNHPFAAPYMVFFREKLDIELMKKGAELFKGTHDFRQYCYQANPEASCVRTTDTSEIVHNDIWTANFFPEESYIYRVVGHGFMRHQIRLMMGSLVSLGKGELTLEDIKESLASPNGEPLTYIAPASGLMLSKVEY